jgi:hypothetical protein
VAAELPHSADAQAAARPAARVARRYVACALVLLLFTAAMVVPFGQHSLDVTLQNRIITVLGPNHFKVWTPYGDTLIWATIWGSVGLTPMVGPDQQAPQVAISFPADQAQHHQDRGQHRPDRRRPNAER